MGDIKLLFIVGLLISCYTDIQKREIPIEIFVNGIIPVGIIMTCLGYFFLICTHLIQLLQHRVGEGRTIPFAPYVAVGSAVLMAMEKG